MSLLRSIKFIPVLLATLTLVPLAAFCQVTAELSADRTEAYLTDEVILRLNVSADGPISKPSLKNAVPNFEVMAENPSVRDISINGRRFFRFMGVFRLKPVRPGEFNIGPAVFSVNGQTVESNSVSVLVRDDAPPAPTARAAVFADASLMNSKGYPGQIIMLRLSIYHAPPLTDTISVDLPDVENLNFTQVGDSTDRVINLSGSSYRVTEASWAISASKPGTYKIPPISFSVPIVQRVNIDDGPFGGGMPDSGFPGFALNQTKIVQVETGPLSLVIKPFPEKGRPSDFGGLVGQFDIAATLKPSAVKTGEAATLTVSMTGRGNMTLLPDLSLGDIPGLKIYPDRPVMNNAQQPEGSKGGKTAKWAIIPKNTGEYSIPSFNISFLNPETGSYETRRTPPLALSVSMGSIRVHEPAAQAGNLVPQEEEESQQVRDIQTIHENAGAVLISGGRISPLSGGLMLFLPLLPLGFSVAAKRVFVRNRGQNGANRAKKALPVFMRDLKKMSDDDADALFKALCAYLTARLGRSGGSITSSETREILVAAKVPVDGAEQLAGLLAGLEAAVFSRDFKAFTAEDRKKLISTVKLVDKAIRT